MNKLKRLWYSIAWKIHGWHFEKRPCYDCNWSDHIPTYKNLMKDNPKHYTCNEFECHNPKMKRKHIYLCFWRCKYYKKEKI